MNTQSKRKNNNNTNKNKQKKPKNDSSSSSTCSLPVPVPFHPPRFEITQLEEWTNYLEENGYVVIADVISNTVTSNNNNINNNNNTTNNNENSTIQTDREQVLLHAEKLCWDFLEGVSPSLDRNRVETWIDKNWPSIAVSKGVLSGWGVGQCEFQWFTRSFPKVKEAFAKIWHTEDLNVSFDGMSVFRPPDFDPSWATMGGWYHVDQNGIYKKGKMCIQGQVNFMDANEDDGGLVVIPKSHKVFETIFANRGTRGKSDFVMFNKPGPTTIWQNELKQANCLDSFKICVKAGDLTLWDSRTIHCNTPAKPLKLKSYFTDNNSESILESTKNNEKEKWKLRRICSYICMTPKFRVDHQTAKAREYAVQNGVTTSHWPEHCKIHSQDNNGIRPKDFKPPNLTPFQKELV